MAVYNIHAGHSLRCRGASGYLDEVNENRKVKNRVIELLKKQGHTVHDCTDDEGATQNQNLSAIVKKCNSHQADLDVSIHLNAGGGTGTEVYYYDDESGKSVSKCVSSKIASALGIKNRGEKKGRDLYILKSTNATAILIECCFVDSKSDANAWDVEKCARAIVEGISDGKGKEDPVNISQKEGNTSGEILQNRELGQVDCYYSAYTDRWWPEVKNQEDWAGKGDNVPICYLGLRVTKGKVKGRVYTKKNGWLPYLIFEDHYDTKDLVNGVLGDGSPIQAFEFYYTTPEGYRYKKIYYCVSAQNDSNFYEAQIDNEKGHGMDGYAGVIGRYADKIQIWIE